MVGTQCQLESSWQLKFSNIDTASAHSPSSLCHLTPGCTLLKCSTWWFPLTNPFPFIILSRCTSSDLSLSWTNLLPPGQPHVLCWFHFECSDNSRMSFTCPDSFPELQTHLTTACPEPVTCIPHGPLKLMWLNGALIFPQCLVLLLSLLLELVVLPLILLTAQDSNFSYFHEQTMMIWAVKCTWVNYISKKVEKITWNLLSVRFFLKPLTHPRPPSSLIWALMLPSKLISFPPSSPFPVHQPQCL